MYNRNTTRLVDGLDLLVRKRFLVNCSLIAWLPLLQVLNVVQLPLLNYSLRMLGCALLSGASLILGGFA